MADAEMQQQDVEEALDAEPSAGRTADAEEQQQQQQEGGQGGSWSAQVLQSCEQALAETGGPVQYLEAVLQHGNAQEFLTWLWDTFGELDDVFYTHKNLVRVNEAEEGSVTASVVHVCALGFTECCAVKPPCGPDLCKKLQAQYVVEGFVTASQPLLVTVPPVEQSLGPCGLEAPWAAGAPESLQAFGLGYVKGFARATSLLMLLHKIMRLGLTSDMSDSFRRSVQQIHVHRSAHTSKLEEALANMRLSARGSLRQANNTIQTVLMIMKLNQQGGLTDAAVFIKRWNQMTSKQFAIQGRRASALKLLFNVCPKARHTSRGSP